MKIELDIDIESKDEKMFLSRLVENHLDRDKLHQFLMDNIDVFPPCMPYSKNLPFQTNYSTTAKFVTLIQLIQSGYFIVNPNYKP